MRTSCAITCVLLVIFINTSSSQLPPRLNIPGAVLVSQPKPFRQARLFQQPDLPAPRARRPGPPPPPIRDIKPVVEEPEEQPISQSISDFDDEVNKLGLSALQSAVRQASNLEEEDQPARPLPFRPERPVPVLRQDIRESDSRPQRPAPIPQSRPLPVLRQEIPQPRPLPVLRQEPIARPLPIRQEIRDEPPVRQPIRQQIRQQVAPQQAAPQPPQQTYRQPTRVAHQPRPHNDDDNSRTRKPPVQILRKYRTDNADGSITWGFENEDGTFKEETLGIDCVTRGKYGYVDPDGMRREYSYETGNKCDQPEEEEELLPQGKQQIVPQARKPQPNIPQPQFRPSPAQYSN